MKKFSPFTLIALFLIIVGFGCGENIESVDGDQESFDPICEIEGELVKKVRGKMEWNSTLDDWVLRIDFDDPEKFESGFPHIECNGFPEELQREGLELICDVEIKNYPNAGAIFIIAVPIELKEYKITSFPDKIK